MSIRDLQDWTKQAGLIPAGAHLQQAVDAIRELQRQINQIVPQETLFPQERFLAVITNGPTANYESNAAQDGGAGSDTSDYRYFVKRILIWGSGPNALAAAGVDTDDESDPNQGPDVYIAINLPEMIVQPANVPTHALPTNETMIVEVFAFWDVGNPQQKHYFFSAAPFVAWVEIVSNQSGGGYYDGLMQTGFPKTLDPTLNLSEPIAPTETWGTSVLVQNIAESNLTGTASHWLSFGGQFQAFYIGMSNESPPRATYRIWAPPQAGFFRVTLSNPVGSAGTAFAAPTFVYDVFTLDGTQIGSAVAVERPRPNGLVTAATMGSVYYNGSLVLAEAWETPGTTAC